MESANGAGAKPVNPSFGLTHDDWGRLVLIDADGQRHVGVDPVRAFPISDPTHWIAICDADGHEIACVAALADLPPPLRQTLEDELTLREFVPIIKRITRTSGEIFPVDWDVETDRGPTQLHIDSEDEIRRLGANRVLIADTRKLRYQVPDTRSLDLQSRRVLERFL